MSQTSEIRSKTNFLVVRLKECVQAILKSNLDASNFVQESETSVVVVIQESDELLRLLWLVERILELGLKNVAFFGSTVPWHYLQEIVHCLPNTEAFIAQVLSLFFFSLESSFCFLLRLLLYLFFPSN